MKKVLFICHGNVGRSQMAQALYNNRVGADWASSAGTGVFEHEGQRIEENPFAEPVIRFMGLEGIDVSQETRKHVTPAMLENADQVIVLTGSEATPEFFKRYSHIECIHIEDPAGADDDTYRRIIRELKVLVERLFVSP